MEQQPERTSVTAARRLEGRLGMSQRQWLRAIEMVTAFALSIAALATSWSGYQASRWNGVMATSYGRASALRVDSTRSAAIANRNLQLDVTLFTSWLEAYSTGNQPLADFYRARFRAEFSPAFEAWIASKPLANADAAKSPFELPDYRLAAATEAARLEQEAGALFTEGAAANQISDDYVLNSVILAMVLVFSGLVQRFKVLAVRAGLLGITVALLLFGLASLMLHPIT